MKVVEIAHVQVSTNVEDERTCSSLSFLKSKVRNLLTTYLDLVVRMFAQDYYTLNTVPYQVVKSNWKAQRVRNEGEMEMSWNVCCSKWFLSVVVVVSAQVRGN